jgi:hypothetical protein
MYLQRTEDLSTWKGGGMGMFASADSTLARYAKVYLKSIFCFPRPSPATASDHASARISAAARSMVPDRRQFPPPCRLDQGDHLASTDQVPLNVFDENGQRASDGVERYHDLYPTNARKPTEPPKWGVEIEYWKAVYDLDTGQITAKLTRTFTYKD